MGGKGKGQIFGLFLLTVYKSNKELEDFETRILEIRITNQQ
jgi:hypothetical protein